MLSLARPSAGRGNAPQLGCVPLNRGNRPERRARGHDRRPGARKARPPSLLFFGIGIRVIPPAAQPGACGRPEKREHREAVFRIRCNSVNVVLRFHGEPLHFVLRSRRNTMNLRKQARRFAHVDSSENGLSDKPNDRNCRAHPRACVPYRRTSAAAGPRRVTILIVAQQSTSDKAAYSGDHRNRRTRVNSSKFARHSGRPARRHPSCRSTPK